MSILDRGAALLCLALVSCNGSFADDDQPVNEEICQPGSNVCRGDDLYSCGPDQRLGTLIRTCDPGTCVNGSCGDPCADAAAGRSYVGCSYWPTVTTNSMLVEDFSFAVAVANAYSEPVEVTVASGANPKLAQATVPPNSVATITLPWVAALKQTSLGGESVISAQVPDGAYHLTSTRPVTVYQFNALNYVLPHECEKGQVDGETKDGKCYSYTNDASLLLPDHALNREYLVIARPTLTQVQEGALAAAQGFFAVTATAPGDTRVDITFSAETQAGTGKLRGFHKGEAATFVLAQGTVLQIVSGVAPCTPVKTVDGVGYCDQSQTMDLTGTLINADKDVSVIAGHDCAYIPYDKLACDHLEEQLFPLKSWGKRYLAAHTTSSGKAPSVYRVVSGEDGNQIRFAPAVHAPVTLARGAYVEFESTQDFEVTGSGRLAVAQFMVGQEYFGATENAAPGDPAMALAVPVEQFRTSYRFLAPESYDQNYVNVIAPAKAEVRLDGAAIAPAQLVPIGSSGFSVAKLKIGGGAHLIEGGAKFGIEVYGVGSYTSYMYPGGLDLRVLVD